MVSDRDVELSFCPRCFASSDSGSWGHVVVGSYCTNCGGASAVTLPRWAIESIREQASWVGKRYYPHKEDREFQQELKTLRALAPDLANRTAEPIDGANDEWWVTQGRPAECVSVLIRAGSREEAIAQARLRLPYWPPRVA